MNDSQNHRTFSRFLITTCLLLGVPTALFSAETEPHEISLAGGKIVLQAPGEWKPVRPKFQGIVQYEFSIPKHQDDAASGRVTIGPTRGNPQSNLKRWIAQYVQPDGASSSDRAKSDRKELDGLTVHTLDLSGTYVRPPFSGGGKFENYRLLAVLIDSEKHGMYYVKVNGPEKTIAAAEKAYKNMIEEIEQK